MVQSEVSTRPMSLLSKCKETFAELTNLANLVRNHEPKEPPSNDESNPITLWFDIREQDTSAGPGLVWNIHNAYRKQDNKVSLVPKIQHFYH